MQLGVGGAVVPIPALGTDRLHPQNQSLPSEFGQLPQYVEDYLRVVVHCSVRRVGVIQFTWRTHQFSRGINPIDILRQHNADRSDPHH